MFGVTKKKEIVFVGDGNLTNFIDIKDGRISSFSETRI